jgi:prophage regulatory protein
MSDRLVREAERRQITSVGRTKWWEMELAGVAPRRRQIGSGSVGWLESELVEWVRTRPVVNRKSAA